MGEECFLQNQSLTHFKASCVIILIHQAETACGRKILGLDKLLKNLLLRKLILTMLTIRGLFHD